MMQKIGYLGLASIILMGTACLRQPDPQLISAVITQSTIVEKQKPPLPLVKVPVVHEAHLSTDWYNQVPTQLTMEMNNYFALAQENYYVEADPQKVKALIVPHAGYYHSGLCAASAYQTLLTTKNLYSKDFKNRFIKRVIILAPSHSVFFSGVALPDFDVYKTIFGNLNIDQKAIDLLSKHKSFKVIPEAFQTEHSLEVQLPWIQKTIEQCTIVPLLIGNLKDSVAAFTIADELKKLIDDSTLILVSSDFVHYGERFEYNFFKKDIFNQVRMIDSLAIEAITKKSLSSFEKVLEDTNATICGRNPIKILLAMVEQGHLGAVEPRLSCYYTSANLALARSRSNRFNVDQLTAVISDEKSQEMVSYTGIVFSAQKLNDLKLENRLTGFEKKSLLALSRDTLAFVLKDHKDTTEEEYPSSVLSPGMNLPYGAFVTLKTKKGELRGCIGHTYAYQPLVRTVVAMTKAAAFNDNRFMPVMPGEQDDLSIEISVLSQPQRIISSDEIKVGKHGVILNKFRPDGSMASAVFLPQVARDQKWDLPTMLGQLSIKAGLDQEAWRYGSELYVFEGCEFSE